MSFRIFNNNSARTVSVRLGCTVSCWVCRVTCPRIHSKEAGLILNTRRDVTLTRL